MTGRTYSDQQWGAIGALVERAGGVDARDKFDAERDKFEKMAGGWRKRIASWNGSTLRRDENDAERFRETLRRQVLDESSSATLRQSAKRHLDLIESRIALPHVEEVDVYKNIEQAARTLKDGLERLNFPAIFTGNELTWRALADTAENEARFAQFLEAIDHIEARAASMAKSPRAQMNRARDLFFLELRRRWIELGFKPATSKETLLVKFIAACCNGVCDPKAQPTLEMISKLLSKTAQLQRFSAPATVPKSPLEKAEI